MARILITGTSRGIGYDTALYLAKQGHQIVATMRNPANSKLVEVAAKESLPIEILSLDVDDQASVDAAFAAAGEIDVLINNAGILTSEPIEEQSVEDIAAVMNTNYLGTVRCTKAIIGQMRERGSGMVINIGSVAGTITLPCFVAYSASKFALEAFSEALAHEMRPFGVKVHLVKPGVIDTDMATAEFPEPNPDSAYPHGRYVKALFDLAAHLEAPAELVAEKLRYLIEDGDDRLRHPVGPDSLQFLGYRSSVDDERFISSWGAGTDEEFLTKTRSDMMMDMGPFLKPR